MPATISKKRPSNKKVLNPTFFNTNNKGPLENLEKIIKELKLTVNCGPKLSDEDLKVLKKKVLEAVSS